MWNERKAFIDQRGCRVEFTHHDRRGNKLLVLGKKFVREGMQRELQGSGKFCGHQHASN